MSVGAFRDFITIKRRLDNRLGLFLQKNIKKHEKLLGLSIDNEKSLWYNEEKSGGRPLDKEKKYD